MPKGKRPSIEWVFRFAPETDLHPGPQYETLIHNYRVFVYRRSEDGMYHFSISVYSGRSRGRFLYRSALDPAYRPSENPHRIVEQAAERITLTAID